MRQLMRAFEEDIELDGQAWFVTGRILYARGVDGADADGNRGTPATWITDVLVESVLDNTGYAVTVLDNRIREALVKEVLRRFETNRLES